MSLIQIHLPYITHFVCIYIFFFSDRFVEGIDAQNISHLMEQVRACKSMADYSEYSHSCCVVLVLWSDPRNFNHGFFLFDCWFLLAFIFLTANPILISIWQAFQKQLVHDHMPCWHCCELISHLSSWSIRAAPCAEGQLVPWHVKQLMNFSSRKP